MNNPRPLPIVLLALLFWGYAALSGLSAFSLLFIVVNPSFLPVDLSSDRGTITIICSVLAVATFCFGWIGLGIYKGSALIRRIALVTLVGLMVLSGFGLYASISRSMETGRPFDFTIIPLALSTVVGIGLMLLPSGNHSPETESNTPDPSE